MAPVFDKQKDTSTDTFNFGQLLVHLEKIEYAHEQNNKLVRLQDKQIKAARKTFDNHSLPIRKECKPQFKQSYKPNTYINTHHHVRSYR